MELESLDISAYVLFFVYVVSTYFSKWKSCIVGLREGRIPTPIILFRVNNDKNNCEVSDLLSSK